ASFLLPTRGVSGLAAAVVGIAIMVFGFTKGGLRWWSRLGIAAVGLAAFIMLPQKVTPIRTVGTGFFPEDARSEFIMAIAPPPGWKLEYTRVKAEEAAGIARAHSELVLYTYTTLGNQATGGVDEGNIYVRLVPKDKRPISAEQFAEQLRHETKQMSGATISVFTNDFNGGFKTIQRQLRGQNVAAPVQ